MHTIQSQWLDLKKKLPRDQSSEIRSMIKIAFFKGATSGIDTLMKASSTMNMHDAEIFITASVEGCRDIASAEIKAADEKLGGVDLSLIQ